MGDSLVQLPVNCTREIINNPTKMNQVNQYNCLLVMKCPIDNLCQVFFFNYFFDIFTWGGKIRINDIHFMRYTLPLIKLHLSNISVRYLNINYAIDFI